MKERRLVLLAAAAALAAIGCAPPAAPPRQPRLQVADILRGADTEGFARALEPRAFVFPDDHGPHPAFAAEWWYLTGNLRGPEGRRFGYQLTFFRTALRPPGDAPARPSAWATDQVWMAHLALTDVAGERFLAFERFERGALGLAGARAVPWHVWLDDWSLRQEGDPFPLRVAARQATTAGGDGDPDIGIALSVTPRKPPVLHGESGLSRKGPSPGNASYYYSFTRLATAGTIRLDGAELAVEGDSWLDREWSSSALEGGVVGWDWLGLQLSDGTELMYYALRRADGTPSPYSAGTFVDATGAAAPLAAGDVDLRVDGTWESPRGGSRYPAAWTLAVPGAGILLRIRPLLADQELDLAFRYWEGAVEVEGRGAGGGPVSGSGYVELTGYPEGGRHP